VKASPVAQKVIAMQTRLAAVLARQVSADGRIDVTAVCAALGISRQTYYKYRRRFEAEGLDGLAERSRRPRHSPTRLAQDVEDAVVRVRKQLAEEGWDNGAISIRARLQLERRVAVPSLRSIYRLLHRRGLVEPEPRKRPRGSQRRFEFPASNDCWQIDAYEHRLDGGQQVVVFEVLDDHSRFLLAALAWPSEDGAGAWLAVAQAIAGYGPPRMLLSDNSLAFSGARRGHQVTFERNLTAAGIAAITARPYHPQTCGKNERLHQTSQRWLRRHPSAATLTALQQHLDSYRPAYNTRPHQGIGLDTPAQRYTTDLRSPPTDPNPPDTAHPAEPTRVLRCHVSARGQIQVGGYGIGLGSEWAGATVTVFRTGHHILIFYLDQLVRELTIDPTRRFQPTQRPRGGTRHTRIIDTIH
jgi:transposase